MIQKSSTRPRKSSKISLTASASAQQGKSRPKSTAQNLAKSSTQTQKSSKKPALIFIHGFRGNHIGLAEVAAEFPDYKVFIPDIPPFGEAGSLATYTPDSYARFIANFITQHKLRRPVLIGHSMGSIIAAATAAKYPDKVNRQLVLLAPISTKPPRPIAALQPLVTVLPNKLIGWLTTRYLFIPPRQNNRELYTHALDLTYRGGAAFSDKPSVRASAKFSANYSVADFNFHNQTLLLSGERDRLIARRHTLCLGEHLDAKVDFVPSTGHLLNYEDPVATATAIRDFLEG